ncbi:hypothetical protein [Polyangium spumosum]|uniref:Uncharacterized protein n=1 Tax=Polyangium spumosum TaxID=889282 RepID=A0A6N7PYJ2_9BACT|nr:hypothetical protein [Polyangium spumosum]MRG95540.1 hypothetical protein [Polyangium spumosum]
MQEGRGGPRAPCGDAYVAQLGRWIDVILAACRAHQVQVVDAVRARTVLLGLAQRSPFLDDPRMREVLGFFGLEKEST